MTEPAQVDIVIVGSGISGMTAALAAHSRGLTPLVIEKASVLGGTSAWSGGVLWIPNNPVMLEAGATDSTADALLYLDSVVGDQGPATSPARKRAFVERGPEMIRFLRGLGVPFVYNDGFPDYYPNLPGGHERGRSLNTAILDLANLGDWNGRLRRQKGSGLKVDLLMARYGEAPDMTRMMTTLAGARMAARIVGRTVWARLTRKEKAAMGLSLMGQLLLASQRQDIEFWTGTRLAELIVEDGAARGVVVERDGGHVEVRARHGVVLTAGGFAHNETMRKEHGRQPASTDWTSTPPEDTGDAILLGIAAGAATALMDEAVWTPASLLPDGTPVPSLWERALPHSIIVDGSGARFCNEAASYMECGQAQYERGETAFPSWLIIDSWHRRRYPFGGAPPRRTPKEWLTSGYMRKADTIEELARLCDIDPAALAATVARFNRMAETGVDEDFHRGETAYDREFGQPGHKPNECLGPLNKPPFYAVASYPGDVGTVGGLLTDEHSRVLRENGSVIAGLYAAGANSATVMGRVYPGAGATLGPGAVFGYIAGLHAARGRGLGAGPVSGGIVQGRVKIWRLSDHLDEGAPEAPVTDPQTGGDIWQIWPATGGPELSVLYCKMTKGHQTGLHSHPSHHYGVIVRGGSLVYTDGVIAEQYEGDLIHVPADVPHAFGGTETQDCWLVDFVKPSMTVKDITFYPERDAEVAAAYAECYRRLRAG